MKTDTTLAFLAIILSIVAIPFSVIYNGYVLSYLWLWFITPLGVTAISTAHAIGLAAIKGVLMAKVDRTQKEDASLEKLIGNLLGVIFVWPSVCLAVGYLIHTNFM